MRLKPLYAFIICSLFSIAVYLIILQSEEFFTCSTSELPKSGNVPCLVAGTGNTYPVCNLKDFLQYNQMNETMKRWWSGPVNHNITCPNFDKVIRFLLNAKPHLGTIILEGHGGLGNMLTVFGVTLTDAIDFRKEFRILLAEDYPFFVENEMFVPNCFHYPEWDWRIFTKDLENIDVHSYFGSFGQRREFLKKPVVKGYPSSAYDFNEGSALVHSIIDPIVTNSRNYEVTLFGCTLSAMLAPSDYMLRKLNLAVSTIKNFKKRPLVSIHLRLGDSKSVPLQIPDNKAATKLYSEWSTDIRISDIQTFLGCALKNIRIKFGISETTVFSEDTRPVIHMGTDATSLVLKDVQTWISENSFELFVVEGKDLQQVYNDGGFVTQEWEAAEKRKSQEKIILDWWIMYSSDFLITTSVRSSFSRTAAAAKAGDFGHAAC